MYLHCKVRETHWCDKVVCLNNPVKVTGRAGDSAMTDVCVLELQPPLAMQCLRHKRRQQSGAIRDSPPTDFGVRDSRRALVVKYAFPDGLRSDPVGAQACEATGNGGVCGGDLEPRSAVMRKTLISCIVFILKFTALTLGIRALHD